MTTAVADGGAHAMVAERLMVTDPMTGQRIRRLATRCLCCDLPLCDAVSVEVGVGPTCRKRIGLGAKGPNRDQVNELTAAAAILAEDGDVRSVLAIAEEVRSLGYPKVADAVHKRFVDIRITDHDGVTFLVKTPYSEQWNTINYQRRLGRWDRELKGRLVAKDRESELFMALREAYPNRQGMTPEGDVFFTSGSTV